mmetsp:Transcript_3720/g.3679  ORF Transcript_3720/g.3679 Transcript_3720/m.3679 type:complete len:418 (+) Transcript_3720:15-1268(+)
MANKLFEVNIATVSYEGSLFTWKGDYLKDKEEYSLNINMTSGFHCSQGSLKAIAISKTGKYLACGGLDERIRIFNMKDNVSLGELSTHTGGITCLEFFEDSYLISGSDDNTLCIWRVHDWVCVHILGGHKSPITAISIHPSGKLILSACKDNVLKVWNLVQGRCAFTRRLKAPPVTDGLITAAVPYPSSLKWQLPSGDHYMIVTEKRIEVFHASDNHSVGSIDNRHRFNQAIFFNYQNLCRVCAIDEGKTLFILELDGSEVVRLNLSSINGRLRDLSLVSFQQQDQQQQDQSNCSLATICTSTGKTLVLNLNVLCEFSSSTENLYERSLVCEHSLEVEPRFIKTVMWITNKVNLNNKNNKKDNKKKKNKIENSNQTESNVNAKRKAVTFDEVVVEQDDEQEAKSKKKQKKNNKKGKK